MLDIIIFRPNINFIGIVPS